MNLYDLSGGSARLLAMTTAFYERAVKDDVLGHMFSRAAADHAAHLASWLTVSFGGPPNYLEDRGDLRFVIYKHLGLEITDAERARWASLMLDSAAEVGMPDAFMRPYAGFVATITRSVQENSNTDPDILRAELGLAPGEVMHPRKREPTG